MKKRSFLLLPFAVFVLGCSASPVESDSEDGDEGALLGSFLGSIKPRMYVGDDQTRVLVLSNGVGDQKVAVSLGEDLATYDTLKYPGGTVALRPDARNGAFQESCTLKLRATSTGLDVETGDCQEWAPRKRAVVSLRAHALPPGRYAAGRAGKGGCEVKLTFPKRPLNPVETGEPIGVLMSGPQCPR